MYFLLKYGSSESDSSSLFLINKKLEFKIPSTWDSSKFLYNEIYMKVFVEIILTKFGGFNLFKECLINLVFVNAQDRAERHDFWSRFLIIHSPFLLLHTYLSIYAIINLLGKLKFYNYVYFINLYAIHLTIYHISISLDIF